MVSWGFYLLELDGRLVVWETLVWLQVLTGPLEKDIKIQTHWQSDIRDELASAETKLTVCQDSSTDDSIAAGK